MTEPKKCCPKCECRNMTKDHQFVMGDHVCDAPNCPCHTPDAPTGNYFQYRPKDVPKLDDDMDAPTEGWEPKEYVMQGNPQFTKDTGYECGVVYFRPDVERLLTQALAEQKARMVEEVEGMKEECTECENREKHDTPRNMLIDDIIKTLSK